MLLISNVFLHNKLVLSVNSLHHTQCSLTSIFKGVTPKNADESEECHICVSFLLN